MRVEIPLYTERFGSVRINDVQRILELDSGRRRDDEKEITTIHKIEKNEIEDVEDKLAIVVPVKEEKLKLLEGVLSGIPHDCVVIVVSNSQTNPINRFKMEVDTLARFHRFTRRKMLVIHQKDPGLALAFQENKYTGILDKKEKLVRDGKAEAMVVGILLAKMVGKEFVGFVDADNYIPGAVNEYVKNFAAGFCMAESSYVMVRNSWKYKPKIYNTGIYFKKWGRISEVTNRYLNLIISNYIGFETEVIKTANSGEHALTMKLAEILKYSSGFSVEPYELLYILEEFGGIKPTNYPEVIEDGVEIFQIETRNPHFHEDKGEDHLKKMLLESLSVVYYSELCNQTIKTLILNELVSQNILKKDTFPPQLPTMPPLRSINIQNFNEKLKEAKTFTMFE
ncbi:MAG: mannosyl-3-phosphoglycerate synthase [Candidatus Hecatellales archaeon ex4484_218]|nr:MAG: mannosyl-3-phosphoglycerate synthase [Candidatus Hecatellales archaeon ex4484_218]